MHYRTLAALTGVIGLAALNSACDSGGPRVARAAAPTYVAKDPLDVPSPIVRTAPATVTVDLVAREVVAEIAPGKWFTFWTFNGTVPGPMIRVREGDTLVVNLTNELHNTEPHNLDFHAAMGPGGGAAVTDVEPGESKSFSFKAQRSGAFIYHCAGEGMPWEHVAFGMYGMIQVDPPEGLPDGFAEAYVGQSEWYLAPAPDGSSGQADGDLYVLDEDKAGMEHPDLFTFNGHTRALVDPAIFGNALRVNQGDRLRVFFVNAGPNLGSSWHIIGQIFDSVYTGHPSDRIRNEETLYVPPGSAAVLELTAAVPGTYNLVDHALWRVPKGALGNLHVDPTIPPTAHDPNGSWPLDLFSPPAFHATGH
ncbi:multicopper oxidase domain-containing protein [Candidatus Binatia bacterium]|nr:multicopper oxidase domain-containing protein [Candidatus Binatia bacterium]